MSLLLEAVPYNPEINWESEYMICQLSFKYNDMPFVLERCCGPASPTIYDHDPTRHIVHCHSPDYPRQAISVFAMVVGSLLFVFIPMCVKCLPKDPYKDREWDKLTCTRARTCCSRAICCCRNRNSEPGKGRNCEIEMNDTIPR